MLLRRKNWREFIAGLGAAAWLHQQMANFSALIITRVCRNRNRHSALDQRPNTNSKKARPSSR